MADARGQRDARVVGRADRAPRGRHRRGSGLPRGEGLPGRLGGPLMRSLRLLVAALVLLPACAPIDARPPGEPLVVTGGTLIDGTERAPFADATIVARDGRI